MNTRSFDLHPDDPSQIRSLIDQFLWSIGFCIKSADPTPSGKLVVGDRNRSGIRFPAPAQSGFVGYV